MKFEIVELADLSGSKATFYSVCINDSEVTLFDSFLLENKDNFKDELLVILQTIKQIANKNGAKRSFFKENEGKLGDLVCALYDTPLSNLRLYCLRLGSAVVILGGGGYKSKDIRALQENEKLTHENALMRKFSTLLYQKLKEGDIYWANDHELAGNLILDTDE